MPLHVPWSFDMETIIGKDYLRDASRCLLGSTSVTCECVSYYTATLANANTFLQLYFDKFTQSSIYPLQYQTYNMLNTLSFLYKKQAVSLLCQRMPYDGDMVGSSSAADPIFWVSACIKALSNLQLYYSTHLL